MIMSAFRSVRPLGVAALIVAAAGLACAQDGADPTVLDAESGPDVMPEIAETGPPPLDLGDADAMDPGDDLFADDFDDLFADGPDDLDPLPPDAPPKPELGPEPASWAAWRLAIDARLDRGVFAEIGAALRAPDYLVPRGAADAAGVRDALSSFFAGGAPFNQRLVTPPAPRRAVSAPAPLRPPPGPEGGTADELAGFFAGVAREAERRAVAPPPAIDSPPALAAPPALDPPPAFAGPPPLRVAPPAARSAPPRPAPPPRVVTPPPSAGDEPALAEDLADFFADS